MWRRLVRLGVRIIDDIQVLTRTAWSSSGGSPRTSGDTRTSPGELCPSSNPSRSARRTPDAEHPIGLLRRLHFRTTRQQRTTGWMPHTGMSRDSSTLSTRSVTRSDDMQWFSVNA
ncbi:hypothetical protein LV779_21555 [Streptomyces thinghirensis]|nr:hypothetical protein [Streptomyces thinghirensis]